MIGLRPGFLSCSSYVPSASPEHLGRCETLAKGVVTQLHQVTAAELNPLYLTPDLDPVYNDLRMTSR